jgi:hypothetical protein
MPDLTPTCTQALYDPKAYIKTFIDLENKGQKAPSTIEFLDSHSVGKEVRTHSCCASLL